MKKYLVGELMVITLILVFLSSCTGTTDLPETSAPIQGEKVNVHAQAYHEMCTREYDPDLCPERYKP